ncbi:MAG TPA: S8 family peptidase [Paracoccaceae bacterium]|nr:S8 family peptidase [Paracoccaceae bacterium]
MQRPLTRAGLALACLAPALSACGPTVPIPEGSPYFDTFYDVYFVQSFAPYADAASNLVTKDARYLFEKSFGWFFSDAPTVTYNSYPLESSRVHFAHAAGLTGQGQIIGFIDSGFDPNHPDFSNKTIYSAESLATLPIDAHGTMVVGVAAADGTGSMIGIAPNADILLGSFDSQAVMADSINLARSIGAVAINNSWGYTNLDATQPGYNSAFGGTGGAAYIQALRDYAAEGVVVFALRNNETLTKAGIMDGLPVLEPQLEPGWVAVGNAVPTYDSTNVQSAERISAACLEAARWCLFADGAWDSTTAGGGYAFSTGASFAAPQVSGALALLAEAFADVGLTPHQLRDRLLASADNSFIGAFDGILDFGNGVTHGFNEEFGHGFLDIRAALLPIGGATVLTESGVALPAGEPAVVTGAAFGDALAQSLKGREVVVQDALAADFRLPAETLAAPVRPVAMSVIRAAEIASGDLAAQRIASHKSNGTGLLGAYSGQMVEAANDGLWASVLLPSGDGSSGLSLSQSARVGASEISVGLSWLSDRGGPLSIGGPGGPLASTVASLDLGISSEIAPGATIAFDAQTGLAHLPEMPLLTDVSQVGFDSLRATLRLTSVGRENDVLNFTLSAPPSVTSGTARTALPTVLAEGGVGYEPVSVSLAPQDRQIDFGVTYQSPIAAGTELLLGAYGSEYMGGDKGSNFGVIFAIEFEF